jgi:hypothetical protein
MKLIYQKFDNSSEKIKVYEINLNKNMVVS